MLTDHHKTFLSSNTISIWIGSADANNVPDTLRTIGVSVEDDDIICCYISQKFAEKFLQNIKGNKRVGFVASEMTNFVTYQYKGIVIETYPSTPEETMSQEKFMNKFCDALGMFGLQKERLYDMYVQQPSITIKFKVEKIFEQTPKKDTGGEIYA